MNKATYNHVPILLPSENPFSYNPFTTQFTPAWIETPFYKLFLLRVPFYIIKSNGLISFLILLELSEVFDRGIGSPFMEKLFTFMI